MELSVQFRLAVPWLNLEHIIPLSADEKWSLPREIVQAYCKRLGNMTLLDPTTNGDVANKIFAEKIPIYQASPLLITQKVASFAKWGPEEIDQRQRSLAEEALKVWTT